MGNTEFKSRIDDLWLRFHAGGVANPLTVIEQITFLMFVRLMDITDSRNQRRDERLNQGYQGIYDEADPQKDIRRWKNFKDLEPDKLFDVVRDEVFPHLRELGESREGFGEYLKHATLMVQRKATLVEAIDIIDSLPLDQGDKKGDLYEYMLDKLRQAGIGGQFRTPGHIIELMVKMVDPKAGERICDPACGTSGFLSATINHIVKENTSENGKYEDDEGKIIYSGDELTPELQKHFQNDMITGFDFDPTMLGISAMNLMVHGIDNPDIIGQDTLSSNFTENYPSKAVNGFDVILANPPFKGVIDSGTVDQSLSGKVKTKKTELLFPVLMLRMLKVGGRCAVILPDGVLFGTSNAHIGLRKMIIEENQLEAVISLPSGVFKPYAGVSTAILVFTKGGKTDNVWFYDIKDDGFSLDDKRDKLYDNDFAGDLPSCLEEWNKRSEDEGNDRSKNILLCPLMN